MHRTSGLCSTKQYLLHCHLLGLSVSTLFLPCHLCQISLIPPTHSSHLPSILPLLPAARDLSATRQEHSHTLEKMKREHELEVQAMEHASQLRKKELEVCVYAVVWGRSDVDSIFLFISNNLPYDDKLILVLVSTKEVVFYNNEVIS